MDSVFRTDCGAGSSSAVEHLPGMCTATGLTPVPLRTREKKRPAKEITRTAVSYLRTLTWGEGLGIWVSGRALA